MSKTLSAPTASTSLLRNTNFILLWCAYAISALGDHLSEMAILKTQNALAPDVDITRLTAGMTFAFFLPFFLLGPFTGALADRLPRRFIMITADIIRAGIMFQFAWLMSKAGSTGRLGPLLPLLAVGIFAAFFSPARSALLPALIQPGQLIRANGLISGLGIIATTVAGVLGGWLATHYDPFVAFRLDAATFALSAICLVLIHPPKSPVQAARPPHHGDPHSLRKGFHYVAKHKRVCELLLLAAVVWGCGPVVYSVIPAVVRDVYQGDYQSISILRACVGVGFVLGAATLVILGNALRAEIAITWGLLGIGASIGALALTTLSVAPLTGREVQQAIVTFAPTGATWASRAGQVSVALSGFFAIGVMASVNALLQRIVPDRFRGRVFGINDVCTIGALLLATGLLAIPPWTMKLDRWVGPILLCVAAIMFAAGGLAMAIRLGRGLHGPKLTFAENLNDFVTKFWWRLQRAGPCTVPRNGAVIIAANHTCAADPLFLCAAARYRPIAFLIAAEYATWPIISFFVKLVDCIPVTRSGQDTGAFKRAVRHLQSGKALGVFIEGRIVQPGEVVEPRDGVAMIALRTGATVIPAHISGTKYASSIVGGLLARHNARLRFGKAVLLDDLLARRGDREAVRLATARIYQAIVALAPTAPQPCRNGEASTAHESLVQPNASNGDS